jgi:serine protease Do
VKIVRQIPEHDSAFLDGCTEDDLSRMDTSIQAAIRQGAPLFNQGDVAGCAQVYHDTVISLRGGLSGACGKPKGALKKGLDREAALGTPTEKAWALRDTFDGIINALARPR